MIAGILCGVASGQVIVPAILDESYGYRLPSPAGGVVWWCEATYKVGRERDVPERTANAVQISAARNEYEPFQVVLRPEATWSNLTVAVSDFTLQGGGVAIAGSNVEVCVVEYVPVTTASDTYFCTTGLHPDPLVPLAAPFTAAGGSNQPLWLTIYVPKDVPAGIYDGTITFTGFNQFSVSVQLRVFDFCLPDVTHTRTAYYTSVPIESGSSYNWHRPATVAQQRAIWDLYMQNYRKHRVSPYSAHLYSPIVWSYYGGKFTFDFREFDAAMERYLDEFGFNAFNVIGHKSPVFPTYLGGYPAFTPEYRRLFAQFWSSILAHLREKGWMEKAYCYWADEPVTPAQRTYVLDGLSALGECAPGLARLQTHYVTDSEFETNLRRKVDIWVIILDLYEAGRPKYEGLRQTGDELWPYVAMGPKSPVPNYFVDQPALLHRIRPWLAEKYGVTGDIYWSVNYWPYNPWTNAESSSKTSNGDGALLYPPTRVRPDKPVIEPPVNSLRWELLREALEDREYFWLLKRFEERARMRLAPGSAALVEATAARNAALGLVTSARVYAMNPQQLYAARLRLAEAIEALGDRAPLVVRQPTSRAVAWNGSAVLRTEALGWPLPAYQWHLNGGALAAATGSFLALSNINSANLGDYSVVASNTWGVATSSVARVEGYWLDSPRIIAPPVDLIRYITETAIFSVTAVSSNTIGYRWLHNGCPLASGTNATLVLTNLDLSQAGGYCAVLSNVAGVTTSAVARLTILATTTDLSLVSAGADWRYHDAGLDLGASWWQTDAGDAAWAVGQCPIGYGEEDLVTVVGSNLSPATVYFRHTFNVAPATQFVSLTGRMRRDDGAAVYVNGTEVFRDNLPSGSMVYATPALAAIEGEAEAEYVSFSVPTNVIKAGLNQVAVAVHQSTNDLPQTWQPVAAWSLDENASPWRDSIGTNHFVSSGANIVAQPGRFGGSVSNSYSATGCLVAADAPELSYSGPFTVGGWFAFGVTTGDDPAITCLGKAGEFRLYYTGTATNRYRFEVNGASVQDQTPGTAGGQWRFVVGWYDGTNISIQVDDGPVCWATATPPVDSANPLIALQKPLSNGGMAADELFFYKRVLSPLERTARYGNRTLPHSSDLSFDFALAGTARQLPQILSPPVSLTRWVGEKAVFLVDAASATPLTYQWYFEGKPLGGATNRLLFLNSVAATQAGQYSVSVSNVAGAVRSSAALAVIGAPEIRARVAAGGAGCTLQIPGYAVPATILVSTNLADWTELVRLPASLTPTNLVDSLSPNAPSRFYRLRLEYAP